MSSPIAVSWANATVMVEVGSSRGSGFLVAMNPPVFDRVVVVTNKHVIDSNEAIRHAATDVTVWMNKKDANGAIAATTVSVSLYDSGGAALWREHPSPEVDVYAFDLSPTIAANSDLVFRYATESAFASAHERTSLDITGGDEVIVVGYPLGLRQGPTNHPLIRQGIIATRIGEELWEDVAVPGGGTTVRKRRGFLFDGATIPGSSGSPVILKPAIGRIVGDAIWMGNTPAMLLGIVAETRYAPISTPTGDTKSFAGLGFAYDVETISETLALF